MEKFAVDLDKVLDDFELDEDESESVNQYEKLQLQFCSDGGLQSSQARHGVGLGAFGGWSEGVQPSIAGQAAGGWCGGQAEGEVQPPGTRSPPDGQNDDGQLPATCSRPSQPVPYQARLPSVLPQPHCEKPAPGPDSGPADQQVSQQSLWPMAATAGSNLLHSLHREPCSSDGVGVQLPGRVAGSSVGAACAPSPQHHPPCPPDSSSQDGGGGHGTQQRVGGQEASGADQQQEGLADQLDGADQAVGQAALDVVASRPLDVLPAHLPPDRGLAVGHDARHPDIIDVWQSGPEGGGEIFNSSSHVEVASLPEEGDAPDWCVEQPHREAAGGGEPSHQAGHCRLPDLMATNSIDQPMEGEAVQVSEPAIVMENTLSNSVDSSDPAIVQESQSCSRIPELVNVHQTAEHQAPSSPPPSASVPASVEEGGRQPHQTAPSSPTAVCSSADGGSSLLHHVPPSSPAAADPAAELQGVSNPICDSNSRADQVQDGASMECPPPPQPHLPDISHVPITFCKDSNADDAELDAELAELEEEQSRLQGAYGGSVTGSLSCPDNTRTSDTQHSDVKLPCDSVVDGPDVIGSRQLHSQGGGAEHSDQDSGPVNTDQNVNSDSSSVCQQTLNHESTDQPDFAVDVPDAAAQETDNLCQHVSAGVEEVICQPAVSQAEDRGEAKCCAGDADNMSNTSSTLTDGDPASPDNNPQSSAAPEPESPTRVTPGSLVTAVYDDDSGSGREDEGSAAQAVTDAARAEVGPGGVSSSLLGQVAPFWIPDEDAPNCQECGHKFTVLRRRHHCRACGRVLCAQCCHAKAPLPYMDYKEARVCGPCLLILQTGPEEREEAGGRPAAGVTEEQRRPPDPNNPMEYCSRVPPAQQVTGASAPPPTVMVPVGVLKRDGSSSSSARTRANKQVIFSDGIRPGGDLTESSGTADAGPGRRRAARRLSPPTTAEYVFEGGSDSGKLEQQMRGEGPPVVFAIHKNLTVLVKMVKLDCCVGVEVWNMATRGLCTVGQEEIVVLLEVAPAETQPPRDIFAFFHTVYQQANQGNLVTELGHTIFTEPEGFLGSREHGGFLYIRPTFQCLCNLVLPPSPYIFAVLIQKWETPWAKVFPLRLMLRMGAEFRYYPCPLVSTRNRKPVFCEIGHTIMNLLVDFRNFAYTVPGIEGFFIHMEEKKTSLLIPKNRYQQVCRAVSNSNDHVLALGANFNPQADSHLVTIQNDDGNYCTQAINIHNRPRKVTGASFIIFNGALKTTSGLSAKSNIVEDGLMVQIPADMMTRLREALQNMKDFEIPCGAVSAPQPDEVVLVRWTSDDKNFNVGIKSAVDEKQMDGIPSVKIHSGTDYLSNSHLIRWTEVFILQGEGNNSSDVNLSRLSELLARSFCVALTPHLADLYTSGHTRLGLRTTIHQDSVGYEAGSGGTRLPPACMKDLDMELIGVIHRAAANITDQPIILELVFHVMEQ